MITKEKLIADPAIAYDGDSVIVHLRDGAGIAITSTGGALDTNVTNTVTVSATDLDIRDLTHVSDSVKIGDGTDFLLVNADGSINAVVTATDLDIRDLSSATDSVTAVLASTKLEDAAHVSGDAGQFVLAVRNDAGTSMVSADGDYAPLQVDASGALRVSGLFTIDGQYAEDSAHVSGNVGIYNLSVRSDAPSIATSADGDYASQTVDAYNRSWVNTGANVAITNGAASVTTTSALLVAAAAGRRSILIQNLGGKAMYIGGTGVSTATGVRVAAGGNTELEMGPALALHAVAESGTLDVRWLQLA
jgi:hypothetical protein